MNKKKIRLLIEEAIQKQLIMNTYLCYSYYYSNLIPVAISNKLLLVINEDDFIFNGFQIVRLKDIQKVKIKDDICVDILKQEGLFDNISMPMISMDSWKSIFTSLKNNGKNIIIEKESLDDSDFFIGKIKSVHKKQVIMREFDANGVWNKETTKIPYSTITTMKFGSRYVDVFSKYLRKE